MSKSQSPSELIIRAYQVGFGDCFLLTFVYPAFERVKAFKRHLLIDFGSAAAPKVFGPDLLQRIAEDVRSECEGKLHMVVATHRHRSAINGFDRRPGRDGPGEIIRGCKPHFVLMPWTENPVILRGVEVPPAGLSAVQAYVRALKSMNEFSAALANEAQSLKNSISKRALDQLLRYAEDNHPNPSAVMNLRSMGKRKPKYLFFGAKLDLRAILPGVKLHLLGPHLPDGSGPIGKQHARDEAAFWRFQSVAGKHFSVAGKPAFTSRPWKTRPPYTRWIIPRLRANRGEQLLDLARILDDSVNNTSLMILFEVNESSFLFPGDAQIESWSSLFQKTKGDSELKGALEKVDFYKASDHGSPDATPEPLLNIFKHRRRGPKGARFQTVVSTMAARHGKTGGGTDAARQDLVDALKAKGNYFSTQELRKKNDLKKVFSIQL